ncbi:hypothetical protein RDABS01_035159, partial [Bienertia sinuspersici]
MASTTTILLLLLPTFLLLILIFNSSFFHQHTFNFSNPSPKDPLKPPSHNPLFNISQPLQHKKHDKEEKKKKSCLEKIEEGLARARAVIREATRTRNFSSGEMENFIPKGSVYRNPYAFHQL